MHQTHVGGDKLFVDYAGDTVPVIVDRLTGEARQAQIFVAVICASSFSLATFRRKISVFRIVADDARKARPAGGWPAGVEERD